MLGQTSPVSVGFTCGYSRQAPFGARGRKVAAWLLRSKPAAANLCNRFG